MDAGLSGDLADGHRAQASLVRPAWHADDSPPAVTVVRPGTLERVPGCCY